MMRSPQTYLIRVEDELVLTCAQMGEDPERAERIRELIQGDNDWAYLLRIAIRHGMIPLLYKHINAVCPGAVHESAISYLQELFQVNARRNDFLTAELLELLNLFHDRGIPAIPLKGPALVFDLCGDLELRKFDNLDIFINKQDVLRARELLTSQRYLLQFQMSSAPADSFLHYNSLERCYKSELFYSNREGRAIVDIHWRIAPRYYSFKFDYASMWNDLRQVLINDTAVFSLSHEVLLIFLCVHGAQGLWQRLDWIYELANLICANPQMDWDKAMKKARGSDGERVLHLGLYLANNLLGAALPEEISRRVNTNQAVKLLAAQVRKNLFRVPEGSPGVLERCLFRIRTRERWRDRILDSYNLAMSPTLEEYRIPLPSTSLKTFTTLFRPLRRIGGFALGMLGRPPVVGAEIFAPTEMEVVEEMLRVADIQETDVVYDLGCGEGRIVITAARQYGARGVGIDIHTERIAESKANARKEGVEHLVKFINQDARQADVSEATVVTMYLGWSLTLQLRSRLQTQLGRGARILSLNCDMGDWLPDKTVSIKNETGETSTVYVWYIK